MFYQIRYQTGEAEEIIKEMKSGNIPCMEVANPDELDWFIDRLAGLGIYKVMDLPYDRKARDAVKEPEFEFRIAFYTKPVKADEVDSKHLMYIDFYFETDIEETYDSIGEI